MYTVGYAIRNKDQTVPILSEVLWTRPMKRLFKRRLEKGVVFIEERLDKQARESSYNHEFEYQGSPKHVRRVIRRKFGEYKCDSLSITAIGKAYMNILFQVYKEE